MKTFWNKHKYIRVIKFYRDKSSTITYHKRESFKPNYLVNPDHVFNANGYSTIVVSELAAETINPLDFKSKYDAVRFKSAINNKLIADTFDTLKAKKFDMSQILLFLSLAVNVIVLYLLLRQMGIF